MRHFNETQGDLMGLFLIEFLFFCAIYRTNVQIERTWNGLIENVSALEL